MIVGQTTKNVEIDHEPNNYLELRELSGLEMDEAEAIRSNKVMKNWGQMGGEVISALRAETNGATTQVIDPMQQYDHETLVLKAIVGWSGPNYDGLPCNDEYKRRLDGKTMKWLV